MLPLQSPAKPPEKTGLPSVSPDFDEQELGDKMDDGVPPHVYEKMQMVGLGGSAGSIGALQTFFAAMPSNSGMAFVVVLHLAPEYESSLPQLLGRVTSMSVKAARDGDKVEANCVYVIPPAKHLTSVDGHLRLTPLEPERGKRIAVDLFFRSLADTHGPHAAAIVLSGADGDGAIGIKRIKERGGLTIAQDPEEAEQQGMPRAAIATGMVDWVLPVAEMPQRLVEYQASERRLRLPPEEGPQPALETRTTADEGEAALREVLTFLRTRTGRDFSYYKRATIVRRVSRRLQINGVDDLPAYLAFLRTHPGEAGALLQDLLISVTNFFRDRESFAVLEQLIPELFKGKGPDDCVRVWVPACATGEEAYSVAMLLLEHARELEETPGLQIFGCDLDEGAIQVARAGVYPDSISADVSEERLRRFFIKEPRGYHVRREVREIVLFAAHDLLKDAPFSRLDLISCRNLLIYLNRDAQQRALDIFHFALHPYGLLFLGSSESVEDESTLFTVLDKKHRIYAHRPTQRTGLPLTSGPSTLIRALEAQDRVGRPVVPGQAFLNAEPPRPAELMLRREAQLSLGELHFRLVERLAPPSVIVNAEHEIVHLSENAGSFLRMAGGEPSMDLLRVVHPMLRIQLRAALFQAAETGVQVEVPRVPLEIDGLRRAVNLRVAPARELAPGFLLVIFERTEPGPSSERGLRAEPEPIVRQLERELETIKGRLRDTVEQYEANTEELKAGNEELQAMNEELRSASEELETSREELQSINEELTTVNQELKSKLEELSHANSDLYNLMASTAIATVFLDRELRIMRYTPSAVPLFRFIPSDIGRPLADLRHRLEYPQLSVDAEQVLDLLVPVEREVRITDGHWFLARLLPYRTLDDRIAGVVLTFVDVTEGKRSREAVRDSDQRLRLILESAKDYAIFTLDLEHRVSSWNSGAQAMLGYAEAEICGQLGDILFTPEDRKAGEPQRETAKSRTMGRAENERWHVRKDGSRFYGSGLTTPLRDDADRVIGFVKIMRDLTESKRAQEALRQSEERLARAIEIETVGVIFFKAGGLITKSNSAFLRMSGYTSADLAAGLVRSDTQSPPEYTALSTQAADELSLQGRTSPYEKEYVRKDGTRWWGLFAATRLSAEEGAEFIIDITARKRAETMLIASEEQFRRAIEDAPVPVIIQAEDGQVVQLNKTWTVLTGYSAAELPSFEAWLDLVSAASRDELRDCVQELSRGASAMERLEVELLTRSGERRSWLFSASPLATFFDGRRYVVGMALDITDSRRSRAELEAAFAEMQRARQQAEAANRTKDHFLATLSHELRTPLTPVLTATESMLRRKDLPPIVREGLAMICRNIELENHLINGLLDITRISRGKLELDCEPMDLHQAISAAIEISRPDISAKQQRLKVELGAEQRLVNADVMRIQQVFWNLLKNASKFTPVGGGITLRSRSEPGWATVEVVDTGLGIEADALPNIFVAFQQADTSITRRFGGLGLGLAIATATVEAHGGTIVAASAGAGQGSTFTVKLPLYTPEGQHE